ncbi:hypothetical protein BDY17DRAFT_178323 [Neohortaea acidophila]|uniref:Uncharacterized protein n=1 Tax=Neohortaea acidophila TaxID=245834 RepID=A0A6A6PQS4_9PEZI|nr:uncharacterized protein BDY17DRAFT_178323 [Neohortaea acidophila]KAF2482146.1 hypothetical protein BDY17DRAFT_178323 [Neohortaea acidophila]
MAAKRWALSARPAVHAGQVKVEVVSGMLDPSGMVLVAAGVICISSASWCQENTSCLVFCLKNCKEIEKGTHSRFRWVEFGGESRIGEPRNLTRLDVIFFSVGRGEAAMRCRSLCLRYRDRKTLPSQVTRDRRSEQDAVDALIRLPCQYA